MTTQTKDGAALVSDGFRPYQYDADLTMNGTAQSVELASGIAGGLGRVQFVNQGATTEAIRVAFGATAALAEANLTFTTDGAPERATTGYYIPAEAEGGSQSVVVLGVPEGMFYYAVGNAVDSDAQVVSITQGS